MSKINLICYELSKTKPTFRTKLHREIYGFKDVSNHGKYIYKREGLLEKVKGKRIIDAVLQVKEQHTKKVITLLQKYGAKVHVFNLDIKPKS